MTPFKSRRTLLRTIAGGLAISLIPQDTFAQGTPSATPAATPGATPVASPDPVPVGQHCAIGVARADRTLLKGDDSVNVSIASFTDIHAADRAFAQGTIQLRPPDPGAEEISSSPLSPITPPADLVALALFGTYVVTAGAAAVPSAHVNGLVQIGTRIWTIGAHRANAPTTGELASLVLEEAVAMAARLDAGVPLTEILPSVDDLGGGWEIARDLFIPACR